jgi:putative oxidoreductase
MGLRPGRKMAAMAGTAEIAGGALLALGLVTPLAAALVIAVMTIAIAIVHWRHGPWVAEGGWEYSVVLIAVAFAVTAAGPGKYSLDHVLDLDLAGVGWALIALGVGVISALVVSAATRVQTTDAAGPHPAAGP